MTNGVYVTYVHGWLQYFKIEGSEIYLPDFSKKKNEWEWAQTAVCPERLKTLAPASGHSSPAVTGNLQKIFSEKRRGKA